MLTREKLIDFLIFTSIFVDSIVFFTSPFEGYLHYFIFLILLPFFVNKYGIPKAPFQILLLPVVTSVLQILLGNDEWFLFFKIFFGMMLSVTFYYYVILYYDYDVEKMFRMFLKWAYWTAVIAIFQYVFFRIGFKPGYDFHWILNKGGSVFSPEGIRLSSIYLEPSQLGIMLGPAAFVALQNILRRERYVYINYQNYIILAAIYLSKSSTGYLGIFIAIIIIGLNMGYFMYLLIFVFFSIMSAWFLYNNVDEFKSRTDAAIALWLHEDYDIHNVNTSSFVQYNNAHVAFENFKYHPLFGTGLGSFSKSYQKYSYTKTGVVMIKGFDFNSQDGNSLLLRLLNETGILGVIFILYVIIKGFVPNNAGTDNMQQYWVISGATLVIIILYLLRQGNYFLNGFPFFIWLYYYNKAAFINKPENESL